MEAGQSAPGPAESTWQLQEREWAKRLGRLRLGVEPIEEQLNLHRKTTLMLMLVQAGIAAIFLALFTAFGRPGIGLWIVGVLFTPMILGAWLGYRRMERAGRAYLAERSRSEMNPSQAAHDARETSPAS
jgi:hypothetical protein